MVVHSKATREAGGHPTHPPGYISFCVVPLANNIPMYAALVLERVLGVGVFDTRGAKRVKIPDEDEANGVREACAVDLPPWN